MEDYFSNEYEATMINDYTNNIDIHLAYNKLVDILRYLNDEIKNNSSQQDIKKHIKQINIDFNNYIHVIKELRTLE